MKAIVFLVAGWSENSAWQNFILLRRLLEESGFVVVIPEYMDVDGSFTKLRTKKSIEEYAKVVEISLKEVRLQYPDIPIIGIGHSMGALILRILYNKGYVFNDLILAGGPHNGVSKKFLLFFPIAFICKVKVFFQMLPSSKFLASLGELPPVAIYIGGMQDSIVPVISAAPIGMKKKYRLFCGNNMFPQEESLVEKSAIPLIMEIVREKY